jgi:predicted aminopeptidase
MHALFVLSKKSFSAFAILIFLSGCHIGYITKAAITEADILLSSREIDALLQSTGEITNDVREKLSLVKEARRFGIDTMGLTPKNSFTRYTDIDKSELAWVLIAAKEDSFELKTWWFPIVGRVPYLGFFKKEDAEIKALKLKAEGFETSIRPTDAFSTLGWFNDPVLSTTLKRDPPSIASTVLHESLHSTIWIPGSVPFNETLAQFVGLEGTRALFAKKFPLNDTKSKQIRHGINNWVDGQKKIAEIVEELTVELSEIYNCTCITREEKLKQKALLYRNAARKVKKIFPTATMLQTPNNAELIQLSLYMTKANLFEKLFKSQGGDWSCFIAALKELRDEARDSGKDPFELLAVHLARLYEYNLQRVTY